MDAVAWAGALVIGQGLAVFSGPGASASRHRHDAVQVLACAASPATVVFDHGTVEGHVVVVPSRTPHRIEGTGERVIVALVEPAVFGRGPVQPGAHDTADWDVGSVAALVGSSSVASDATKTLARGTELIGLIRGCPTASPRDHLRSEVARAVELIDELVEGVPKLSDVASEVALSPSRLSRVFAEEVGFPFRRYVLWARLRRAARAVLAGADMTTAAAAAGFSDSAHFSRVFRATFGLTPSEILPILDIAELQD